MDDLRTPGCARPNILLGAVLPKRHAKRAVTRSLLKRQIRAALAHGAAAMTPPTWPAGVCVVRLRAPFERAQFTSAASNALQRTARGELDAVLDSARRRLGAERVS